MKKIKNIYKTIAVLLLIAACTDTDVRELSFLDSMSAPTNLEMLFSITQDNTGAATITPNADGASTFDVYFGDATTEPLRIPNGENAQHVYAEGTYDVKLVAYNTKGDATELTKPIVVSFRAPENLMTTIENDAAVSKQVNVSASADFAMMYEFHSGEAGVTQPVATANIGEALSYQYADAGTYTVQIIAKGGAIETTTYTVDFEVTEILAPTVGATTPPGRDASDVVSIFSDAYTNVTLDELPTSWSSSGFEATTIGSDNVWKLTNLDFVGMVTNYANGIDVAGMEMMHIDYWVPEGVTNELLVKIVNTVDGGEDVESLGTTVAGSWQSVEIDMANFDGNLANKNKITQLLIDSDGVAGIVYVDNFYFYKASSASTFDDGLLTNGDFEAGSEAWLVGVDDNSAAPVVTVSGNTYYSFNVTNAGNPYDVNMSQKVEIIDGNTYTLTFDAWSDTNRPILAGVGLSASPWSNTTETVNLTTTRTTYSVTVAASGYGAPDARVIFDLGAATGLVNIDNVSLRIGNGNLVTNGDFQAGSASWLVGVDDNSAAPVVTENGNTYYSVSVATAGNPYDVNMSQKLEIIDGNTYTLVFDAWSDTDRNVVAGIGLSGAPWSNTTETVAINTTRTTYSVTVAATGYGAPDARVLFDLGADTGMVNIDNVSLSIN
ncbi:carbohydrate binding domain-containing protein [Polaribacter sp.]|nr:carbohydrate binding domain-containing protein [Polaribacter sp.]MDB9830757.1 carbohydrate binding domain-containing protein [Polaribacter sp.]MDC1373857.1 carbohydrate binding domain-containing protein [Polaribacter sp.]